MDLTCTVEEQRRLGGRAGARRSRPGHRTPAAQPPRGARDLGRHRLVLDLASGRLRRLHGPRGARRGLRRARRRRRPPPRCRPGPHLRASLRAHRAGSAGSRSPSPLEAALAQPAGRGTAVDARSSSRSRPAATTWPSCASWWRPPPPSATLPERAGRRPAAAPSARRCTNALDAQAERNVQLPITLGVTVDETAVTVTITDHAGGFEPDQRSRFPRLHRPVAAPPRARARHPDHAVAGRRRSATRRPPTARPSPSWSAAPIRPTRPRRSRRHRAEDSQEQVCRAVRLGRRRPSPGGRRMRRSSRARSCNLIANVVT